MAGSKTMNGAKVNVDLIWDGDFDQGARSAAAINDTDSKVTADLSDNGRLVFNVTIPVGDGLPMPGSATLTGVTVTIVDVNR
jgi:hypothetical protein